MGTKKGGARKGQPKGARLGYDDVPKKKETVKINMGKPAKKSKKTGKVTFGTGWGSERSMKWIADCTKNMDSDARAQYSALGALLASYNGITGEDGIELLKKWGRWKD